MDIDLILKLKLGAKLLPEGGPRGYAYGVSNNTTAYVGFVDIIQIILLIGGLMISKMIMGAIS